MSDDDSTSVQLSQPSEGGDGLIPANHEKHCFVVMPFGNDRSERRWFKGWYEVVIEPAVEASGYIPILAAAEEQPGAINDEIRSHLAFDPMVVVDLGGYKPEDPPNPNVMYELGIRHAFGLPLVIMAWEGQRLPFDVSNQRAILSTRDLLELQPTCARLETFIRSAASGKYYKPMDAVGREAAIDATSLLLGEDSLLGALAAEVKELRGAFNRVTFGRPIRKPKKLKLRHLLGKSKKLELWPIAQGLGFDAASWGQFLSLPAPEDRQDEMRVWNLSNWTELLVDRLPVLKETKEIDFESSIPEQILEEVALHLPGQPWSTGVHKEIAEKLSLTNSQVGKCIRELIRRGRFQDQEDGTVVEELGTSDRATLGDEFSANNDVGEQKR